eukprot:scaffold422039_cov41-Prasinocladus_malaysianus.AAC.1
MLPGPAISRGKSGMDVKMERLTADRRLTDQMAISPTRSLRGFSPLGHRKVTEPALPQTKR